MSEGAPEGDRDTGAITDDQLPEDLQPGEGNPLAEPLPAGDTADLGVPDPAAAGSDDEDADADSTEDSTGDSTDGES